MPRSARFAAVLGFALLFLGAASTTQASGWTTMKPTKSGKGQTIVINGKKRTYYRLTPGESLEYTLEKNSKIRLITRVDFRKIKSHEAVYSYRVGFDESKTRLYANASTPMKNATIKGKGDVVGFNRFLTVTPPKSAKTLVVRLGRKARHPVYFRIQQEGTRKRSRKVKYVAITPESYVNAIGVSVRENLTTYYDVDPDKKLTVAVNGPTKMKVLVRVMMDDTMHGTIKFPLAVYEDGTLKNTYSISTTASEVSVIIDHPDVRPTRGDAIYIQIPKGRHEYTFALPENHKQAILRFFLPDTDLNQEAPK